MTFKFFISVFLNFQYFFNFSFFAILKKKDPSFRIESLRCYCLLFHFSNNYTSPFLKKMMYKKVRLILGSSLLFFYFFLKERRIGFQSWIVDRRCRWSPSSFFFILKESVIRVRYVIICIRLHELFFYSHCYHYVQSMYPLLFYTNFMEYLLFIFQVSCFLVHS